MIGCLPKLSILALVCFGHGVCLIRVIDRRVAYTFIGGYIQFLSTYVGLGNSEIDSARVHSTQCGLVRFCINIGNYASLNKVGKRIDSVTRLNRN